MWYMLGILIGCCIWGLITDYVAKSKGYDKGFWWGFWLWLIGLLVVGFRPNLNETTTTDSKGMYGGALSNTTTNNAQVSGDKWTCVCGASNSWRLDTCPVCRRSRDANLIQGADIKCPHCGAMNNPSRVVCVICDKPLKESPKPVEAQPDNENSIELLEKLADLNQRGILSEEEYQKKKAEVLERL